MNIIDSFNVAVEHFLKHRIDTFLFEIDSENEVKDLSQSIDNLLDEFDLSLNKHVKNELSEKIHDCMSAYNDYIMKKIYLKSFFDGLKFEEKWKEVV